MSPGLKYHDDDPRMVNGYYLSRRISSSQQSFHFALLDVNKEFKIYIIEENDDHTIN
jgi:hypothetical protein